MDAATVALPSRAVCRFCCASGGDHVRQGVRRRAFGADRRPPAPMEAPVYYITLSEARSLLYQRRCSRANTRFSAFVAIYKTFYFSQANFANFCKIVGNNLKCFSEFYTDLHNFQKSDSSKNLQILAEYFAEFCRIL